MEGPSDPDEIDVGKTGEEHIPQQPGQVNLRMSYPFMVHEMGSSGVLDERAEELKYADRKENFCDE